MAHLTRYERDLYARLFLEVDTNCDGYLNEEELGGLCAILGFRITPNQLKALFAGIDTDGNNRITLDEFLAVMPTVEQRERNCAHLRRLFLALDANGDGYLTVDELYGAIKRDGVPIPIAEIQALVRRADNNDDGRLNYEEFLNMAMSLI